MSMNSISKLDIVDFTASPDMEISQLGNIRMSAGIQDLIGFGGGHHHPLFAGVQSQRPVVGFQTGMLATVLGGLGAFGAAVTNTINFYCKLMSTTGSVARATTSHQRVSINFAYVHWERITLPDEGDATVDVVITIGYDGTNEPLVATGSVALPSNTDDDERYTLGPVYINGSQIQSVKNVVIESGVELEVHSSGGEVWPTLLALRTGSPTYSITTTEVSPAVTAGVDGVALNGTNGAVVYARHMTDRQTGGVSRVANATTTHQQLTMLNGKYHVDELSADGTDPFQSTIRVVGSALTDSAVPLTIDTTAAIP